MKMDTNTKKLRAFDSAERRFRSELAELLCYFDGEQLHESLSSFIELNFADELQTLTYLDSIKMRELLDRALISLIQSGALIPVAELSSEAEAQLNSLRTSTGIGSAAVPPPPKSAEELLREEIADDWRNRPMAVIKLKKNSSKPYRDTLERMAADGSLESSVTSLQRAGS
jgi:hypothetical protein